GGVTGVLRSAPENLAAIRGVAEIHDRRGELTEALAQYRAALALAKNDPDLQRTVAELARTVEPLAPPASADGLSFEQMQSEFLKLAPPPVVAPPVAAGAEDTKAEPPSAAVDTKDTKGTEDSAAEEAATPAQEPSAASVPDDAILDFQRAVSETPSVSSVSVVDTATEASQASASLSESPTPEAATELLTIA